MLVHVAANRPQVGSKLASSWPQVGASWPRLDPVGTGWPKLAPKRLQVGPKRHNFDREVLPEMSGGQEEQQEQVGAQACTSNTELEGSCGQGQAAGHRGEGNTGSLG